MPRLVVTLLLLSCGCAQVVGDSSRPAADAAALSDARPDAASTADASATADAAPILDVCMSVARPTGRCSAPGVCCLSSTCVMGICR